MWPKRTPPTPTPAPNPSPNPPTPRPAKPSLGIGTATVTLAYSDLTGLLRYVEELEAHAVGFEAERRLQKQHALSAGRSGEVAATLRAAIEVARFPVAYFHPSENLGSHIPSDAFRTLADGLVQFFGTAAPEAEVGRAFREYAQSADDYREYRKAREAVWRLPCATCGCSRAEHAEVPGDPLVRGTCSKHWNVADEQTPRCDRYVPSAEMPPLPGV